MNEHLFSHALGICMYKTPVHCEFEVITKQLNLLQHFCIQHIYMCDFDRNLWSCFYCKLGKGMGEGQTKGARKLLIDSKQIRAHI